MRRWGVGDFVVLRRVQSLPFSFIIGEESTRVPVGMSRGAGPVPVCVFSDKSPPMTRRLPTPLSLTEAVTVSVVGSENSKNWTNGVPEPGVARFRR